MQFIAGTEPTTSVLSFALLYMVREPEVQDRVRAEIHDVLGTSRFPESSDRQAWLPDGYSQIFRMDVFGPLGFKDFGSATLRCKI